MAYIHCIDTTAGTGRIRSTQQEVGPYGKWATGSPIPLPEP